MKLKAKIYTRTNDSGTHYARIVVPKELRGFVSKAAMWRSLATKKNKDATDKCVVLAAALQLTLQDSSDANIEDSPVVKVSVAFGDKPIDLDARLDKINSDDLLKATEAMRQSLGIPDPTVATVDDAACDA